MRPKIVRLTPIALMPVMVAPANAGNQVASTDTKGRARL